MRVNQSVRIASLLAIALGLALACSFGALFTARHVEHLMATMVADNFTSLRAASALENTLLEQRGLVSAYLLQGGDQQWLTRLDEQKTKMRAWMSRARGTARTQEERSLLDRFETAYSNYDARRNHVIQLYGMNRVAQAQEVLLAEVVPLQDEAHELCQRFAAANEAHIERTVQLGRDRVSSLTLAVGIGALVALAAAISLLVLMIHRLLRPVRQLAMDARGVVGHRATEATDFPDELRELEFYSRALMSDVTATRVHLAASERKAMMAEKLAAVGRFAASIAHEIRNPLASMKIWLYEMRQATSHDPKLKEKSSMLAEDIARLEEMAEHLLQFSSRPELQLRKESLSAVVDRSLCLATHRLRYHRLQRERHSGGSEDLILADARHLSAAILNLIVNAIEATPSGGDIRVSESLESGANGAPDVIVRVEDAGPGLPAQVRDRLFEPFVTGKPMGTGLGLSIASAIVIGHGGSLTLEASSNQGCVFAVRIPAAKG